MIGTLRVGNGDIVDFVRTVQERGRSRAVTGSPIIYDKHFKSQSIENQAMVYLSCLSTVWEKARLSWLEYIRTPNNHTTPRPSIARHSLPDSP